MSKKQSISLKDHMQMRTVQELGTWVQCSNDRCSKWRYLPDVHDPGCVPELWTCSLHPDEKYNHCDKSEEEYDESDHIFTKYTEGSVVWAKMSGYPWWPGMIEIDPDFGEYFELSNPDSMHPVRYHVVFFDDKVSRAWIPAAHLNPFNELLSVDKMVAQAQNLKKNVSAAASKAKCALGFPLKERLHIFSFSQRYKGKWGRAPRDSDADNSGSQYSEEGKDVSDLGSEMSEVDKWSSQHEEECCSSSSVESVQGVEFKFSSEYKSTLAPEKVKRKAKHIAKAKKKHIPSKSEMKTKNMKVNKDKDNLKDDTDKISKKKILHNGKRINTTEISSSETPSKKQKLVANSISESNKVEDGSFWPKKKSKVKIPKNGETKTEWKMKTGDNIKKHEHPGCDNKLEIPQQQKIIKIAKRDKIKKSSENMNPFSSKKEKKKAFTPREVKTNHLGSNSPVCIKSNLDPPRFDCALVVDVHNDQVKNKPDKEPANDILMENKKDKSKVKKLFKPVLRYPNDSKTKEKELISDSIILSKSSGDNAETSDTSNFADDEQIVPVSRQLSTKKKEVFKSKSSCVPNITAIKKKNIFKSVLKKQKHLVEEKMSSAPSKITGNHHVLQDENCVMKLNPHRSEYEESNIPIKTETCGKKKKVVKSIAIDASKNHKTSTKKERKHHKPLNRDKLQKKKMIEKTYNYPLVSDTVRGLKEKEDLQVDLQSTNGNSSDFELDFSVPENECYNILGEVGSDPLED